MRFKSKLHYTLKYLILAFPILLILGHIFAPIPEYYDFYTEAINSIFTFIGSSPIAETYTYILLLFEFDLQSLSSIVASAVVFYPLWVFYVYLFDLLVDVLTFIPKFFHDLTHKEYK